MIRSFLTLALSTGPRAALHYNVTKALCVCPQQTESRLRLYRVRPAGAAALAEGQLVCTNRDVLVTMLKRIASLNILNMSPSPSPANPALSAVLDGDDTAVEQSHAGEAGAGAAPPDTDAVEGKSRRLRRLLTSTPTEERFCSISRISPVPDTIASLLHCCIRQHRRCPSTPRTHIMLAQRFP